ncbi:Protein POOR HOMOLOGOUS SYNAPSIS 1 [Glycine soja]
MAGNLAVIEHSNKNSARLREQWEICFARFIPYPTLPPSSDLLPLPPRLRNLSPRGNWISSSSVAFLRLSLSHLLLTVSLNAALLEEHYVTKLHFTWPQVSCVSGYPARGIRTVIVSYRDSLGEARFLFFNHGLDIQMLILAFLIVKSCGGGGGGSGWVGRIQKFAMRFPTIYEAESFINVLKEILKGDKDPEPLNTDFGSEISSQSEFMSTNKLSHSRACEDLSFMTPVDNYIPQLPLYANNEVGRPLGSQEKGTTSGHNFEGMLPALPPSFSTLLMDCSQNNHAQSIVSEEIELKSQIVRYMEDSSFQDMLVKVEKVISELGVNCYVRRKAMYGDLCLASENISSGFCSKKS